MSAPTTFDAPHLLCFGFGYTAAALTTWLPYRWAMTGTRRNPGAEPVSAPHPARRVRQIQFDGTAAAADAIAAVADATHILVSVPPRDAADLVVRHFAATIAAAPRLRWLGYLSTTGVYGDRGGDWVDETTPVSPSGPRGQARVNAEQAWLELGVSHGVPVHVFRLPGIYGPGRSALDTVRAGTARRVVKPGHVFSRIHVADIAMTLSASMHRPDPGAIYNVCDDVAAPPQDVIAYACQILGLAMLPPVAFADADLSPMARSFYADNKRVANRRIKHDLGVTLAYPDFRAGLAAIHRAAYLGHRDRQPL